MFHWEQTKKYDVSKMTPEQLESFLDFCDSSDEDDASEVECVSDESDDDVFADLAPISSIHVGDAAHPSITPVPEAQELIQLVPESEISAFRKRIRSENTDFQEVPNEQLVTSSTGRFIGDPTEIKNNSEEFKNIKWEKKNLQIQIGELAFQAPDMCEFSELQTPYDFFSYFITDELLEIVCEQTNVYALQKNINSTFECTVSDIRKYIGILIIMSVYKYPCVRSFWGKRKLPGVYDTMTVNRFEEIRRHIHFADNSKKPTRRDLNYDALYSVRPVLNHLNKKFGAVPMAQRLSVDEQMCATKMSKTNIKQYMPSKPHKWGFKIFSICDTKGFSHQFEVYAGAAGNVVGNGDPDLGAASNVVLRLSKGIPNFQNHIVYFDNFFTSLGLLVYLRSRGIHSLGTVRVNRIPNCPLSTDLELKRESRGYSEEYVGKTYGVEVNNVLWKDNKGVRLTSTYVGVQPFISQYYQPIIPARRWNRASKQYDEIDCPNIVKEYNQHMGGVDLMDSLIGRYKISMKTGKWPSRLFHHFLDLALVNSYVLYHRVHREKHKLIQLPKFREAVGESLVVFNLERKKIGRPTKISKEINLKPPNPSTTVYLPSPTSRFDRIDHWCEFKDSRGRCQNKPCQSQPKSFCAKCKVFLCNSNTKSCFKDFHCN